MLSATITLTDAQIKDVNTPYVIVPATETLEYSGTPTQIFVPILATVLLDNVAGGYTNVSATAEFILAIGSDWSNDVLSCRSSVRLESPGKGFTLLGVTEPISGETDGSGGIHAHDVPITFSVNLKDGLEDNALAFVVRSVGGDLTGGNAANTLKVTVYYVALTL